MPPLHMHTLHRETLHRGPSKLGTKPKSPPQAKGPDVILPSSLPPPPTALRLLLLKFGPLASSVPPARKAHQAPQFTSNPTTDNSIYSCPLPLSVAIRHGLIYCLRLLPFFLQQNVNLHERRVFGLPVTTESPADSPEHVTGLG